MNIENLPIQLYDGINGRMAYGEISASIHGISLVFSGYLTNLAEGRLASVRVGFEEGGFEEGGLTVIINTVNGKTKISLEDCRIQSPHEEKKIVGYFKEERIGMPWGDERLHYALFEDGSWEARSGCGSHRYGRSIPCLGSWTSFHGEPSRGDDASFKEFIEGKNDPIYAKEPPESEVLQRWREARKAS